MKMAVEDPVYFSSVKFKVKLNGELQNILFLCNYQMFSPRHSPTLNWKRYSSLKTPINSINLVLIVIERKQNKS